MQPVRLLVTAADGSEVLQLGFGAIRKDVNGFTAEASPGAMADEIQRIFRETDLRQVGETARQTIPLSWEKLIPRVLERYQVIIDQYGRTR